MFSGRQIEFLHTSHTNLFLPPIFISMPVRTGLGWLHMKHVLFSSATYPPAISINCLTLTLACMS